MADKTYYNSNPLEPILKRLGNQVNNYVRIDDMTWQCIYCGGCGDSVSRVEHEEGCQLYD